MMKREKQWPILMKLALMGSLLAPLVAWTYISFFTRYWYDDFCYTAVTNKLGLLRSVAFEYRHWTGRYTLLIVNAVLVYLGPRTASVVSATLLLAWLVVATWAIYQLFLLMRLPAALISSLLLAELIVFATLNSTPDIVASFYWQTGALVYTLPFVLLMLYVGVLLYLVRRKTELTIKSPWILAGALLTFVAGGCSETYGAVQIVGLSFLILFSMRYAPDGTRRLLLLMGTAGLLGALASFAILAVAPGNDVRKEFFPPHPQFIQAVKSSLSYSLSFVERHTRRNRGTTFVSLLFPLWLACVLHRSKVTALAWTSNRRRVGQLLALTPVAVFSLLVASVAPGFYVLSEAPPGRALIFPKFVLVAATAFWVFIGSLAFLERLKEPARVRNALLVFSSVAVLVLSVVSPLASARRTFALRTNARDGAALWDREDQEMQRARSMGVRDLVLPAFKANDSQIGWGRRDLLPGADPNAATNRCLCDYYGLDTITLK